jgi:hypothetical protein|tara:strand:+ start:9073 stop:9723 length:651 start_codon:yes stop_codon:yes gene_type:complete
MTSFNQTYFIKKQLMIYRMRILFITALSLLTLKSIAQKDIQKQYLVFDAGFNFTGGLNLATSNVLIPKIGYTSNVKVEHEFNNGHSIMGGIGTSLDGFVLNTRFKNVLHVYNLNIPFLFGTKYDNGDRFYIGLNPSYCLKSTYSEVLNILTPNKWDLKMQFSYARKFNRNIGLDITSRIGILNNAIYKSGFSSYWDVSAKVYFRFILKKSVAFIAQ